MAFIVLYDACVLHPAPLRDLLIRIAHTGVVHARWSEQILDECFRGILARRPDLKPEALARTRELMNDAVSDCLVEGFKNLIDGLSLPDLDDRHVLAAAIRAGAQAIVTTNLQDFPAIALETIDLAPALVAQILTEQAAALKNPPQTVLDLLRTLHDLRLVRTVAKLRELYGTSGLREPSP